MVYDEKENNFEWITGSDRVTASITQKRFISKFEEFAVKYPDKVEIAARNPDGSVLVHFPLNFVKFRGPINYTEEQLEAKREQARRNLHK